MVQQVLEQVGSRVAGVLGSGVHLIHCCQPGEVKDTMAWQRRCLPWPAVSTGALFVLLTKWSGEDQQAGAMEGAPTRKVCKDMFSTIVTAAFDVAGPSALKVFMVKKWVPFLPVADEACVARSFNLTLTGRQLDLEGFLSEAIGQHRNPVANAWLVEMKPLLMWQEEVQRS